MHKPLLTSAVLYGRRSSLLLVTLWQWSMLSLQRTLQGVEQTVLFLSERPLLCLTAGLVSGSLLATALQPSLWVLGSVLIVGGLSLLWPWPLTHLQRCCRLGALGLAVTSLALCWQRTLPPNHIVHHLTPETQRITVEGTLDRPVEPRNGRQHVYLQLHRLQRQEQVWQPVRGLIRLNVQADALSLLPGDVVRVDALRLHRVRGLQNPGGFDFGAFMQRQGIYAMGGVSNASRLHVQHRPAGLHVGRTLERWRQRLAAQVRACLPEPYDTVFLAMVLGQRDNMPATLQNDFRDAGVAHLLVVSGLNVGFIAVSALYGWRQLLRTLRSRLPRAWVPGWRPTPVAALLSWPPTLLYCCMVGWDVPTTRAAVMVGSYLLALSLDRTRDTLYALLLAAALLLVPDPEALFDLSFQLSFGAVMAILLASRSLGMLPLCADDPSEGSSPLPMTLQQRMQQWGHRGWAYVLINTAAYLGTVPILVSAFRTLPTFGIIANLLLVPLAGVLVPAGVAALILLTLWPAVAPWVFAGLQVPLVWIVALTSRIADLPRATLFLASPSWLMLVSFYGLLGSLLFWPRWRWRWECAGLCALLVVLGGSWQYMATRPHQLRVTFLDVGSGDAIFVQIPGSHHLLIDGGGTYDGRFDIGAQVIAPFLRDHYVRRFDLLALTHPHPNHARGLVSVLQQFPAQHLLTNGTPLTTGYLRELLAAGSRWGTRHHTALTGPRHWHWERLQLTVLSPPATEEQHATTWQPQEENDRSLVLRLQYGTVRLLLTGDIQHTTERWLLAQNADVRADILQVPHHGSKTSTLPAFVQRVQPRDGIISLGTGNPYGHPHPRVLDTLTAQQVRVWRTDAHGAITITSDGSRYDIVPFLPYRPVSASQRL
jgi:competence protein ComEC